jgi:hypothetical protein
MACMASRIDQFIAGENWFDRWFDLCGTDISGQIGGVSTKIWIPLCIDGICEQWWRARGCCGKQDVGGGISLWIVARLVW